MKIEQVSVLSFVRVLDGRAWNPTFRWRERRAPFVVVRTRAGATGIGEAWSRYADWKPALDALTDVASGIVGQAIEHPLGAAARIASTDLGVRFPAWAVAAAKSAIDIALWDAFGHEQAKPIWKLLGGEDDLAAVYASGGLYRDQYSEKDLEQEMSGYVRSGFRSVKMKIAGLPKDEDLRRVDAVRRAIGNRTTLWADAVNQWDISAAIEWSSALRDREVTAIQAPIAFEDVAGLARINRWYMPVIAAESAFKEETFHELLRARAVTYLQFCLPLCGGFSGASQLDDLASQYQTMTTPQCFSTAVAQAATLHFAAARRNVAAAEFHCYHDHLSFLYQGTTGQIQAGSASAGSLPGLGVRVPSSGAQPDGSVVQIHRSFA